MTAAFPAALREKIRQVRLIALDVDGVLTDGRLLYLPDGGLMPSGFHVHDGLAIRVAIESGIKVIFVSGNWTEAVRARAEHLRVSGNYLGVGDKVTALEQASQELGVNRSHFAYVGDDLNDLAPMAAVLLAITVPDASDEIKARCDFVTRRPGGGGAVREIIEIILREQGLWDGAVQRFLGEIEKHGFRPGE